jgi:hypothetical protein
MGADEHPHSDSTMVIVGVDLNHRSPGYEPGGMDLATLPRFRKHIAQRLFKREHHIPQQNRLLRTPIVELRREAFVDTKRRRRGYK